VIYLQNVCAGPTLEKPPIIASGIKAAFKAASK